MLPVVSLDIMPADIPAEYAPEMTAACTEALTEGSCVLASSLPESARPDAVGLVLWKGQDYRQVTVRVGRGSGQWVVRALTFADADSIAERWVTVGLTVATLVGESRAAQPATPRPPAVDKVRPEPKPNVPRTRRPERFDAAFGVLTGPGWNAGGAQFGVWLSGGIRLPTTPFAFHAFGSYAQSQGPETQGLNLRTRWLTAGVSGGAIGTLRALNLQTSAALELAFRQVQADFNGHRASDREMPVRVRVMASYPAEGRVALTIGANLRVPPLGSAEHDPNHLQGPSLPLELLGGIEVRL